MRTTQTLWHLTVLLTCTAMVPAIAAGQNNAATETVKSVANEAKPAPAPTRPTFAADGTVHVPAFDLPPSLLSSPEAQAALRLRGQAPAAPAGGGAAIPRLGGIEGIRSMMELMVSPMVKVIQARYQVNVTEQKMADVPVRIYTPASGRVDPRRVLINLHGGAFMLCADGCATLESQPISALGGFKVISVNYRQGPEAVFPAASEDVAAVYRELLKTYKPKQIGIYGCSAGGSLSAQVAAWLPAHGMPQAGAIGIFGSGAVRFGAGDSTYIAGYIDGSFPPPPKPGEKPMAMPVRSYFEGADMNDALVSPAGHLDVLAKFPPTLVITGTRAPDLSPAVYTHSQLVKAGVPGNLIVGEGLGHCYIYDASFPESQDAYQTIINFFRKNLG
jgi:monoterpene epsilon-lactone hydrolase